MVEDLIKRLRNWRDTHLSGLAREAADLIEQQAARLAALKSERDALLAAAGKEAAGTPIEGSPAFALRGLYKLALEYFIDGKPCTPDEYIAWQAGIIEAISKAKLPDPKYYGGSADEGDQHEVKCAYVDGWNDCRGAILAAPTAALEKGDGRDAERYRHLRQCNSGSLVIVQIIGTGEDDQIVLTEEHADEAIDAALSQQKAGVV
ncbi:hypothetical protein SB781_03435 [Paraburkholderia sp. SIMBA_061]